MASNAENVSIWWRHHVFCLFLPSWQNNEYSEHISNGHHCWGFAIRATFQSRIANSYITCLIMCIEYACGFSLFRFFYFNLFKWIHWINSPILPHYSDLFTSAQRAHDTIITSLFRQNDVAAPFDIRMIFYNCAACPSGSARETTLMIIGENVFMSRKTHKACSASFSLGNKLLPTCCRVTC